MKSILCYGDSLTYGADPATGGRHALADRWPSALGAELGDDVHVVAEGLGGRTTAFDDYSATADRNGVRVLPTILASHSPLDLVIVMLGTNDLKPAIHGNALAAANGIRRMIAVIHGHYSRPGDVCPQVLIVSPPHAVPSNDAEFAELFGDGVAQSKRLAGFYKQRADEAGVHFFDAAEVAVASNEDGVHLDAANTRAIGRGLAPLVAKILGL
ncbi:SGNH/GDSL hydrolase family protein [Mariluticola halotolerans]|uniref:SGNH/GDSL hydrolase family protein n=1 Tax=Mariluticola halotolerans TaxID=2909283 RepID=UPI0026E2FC8A|nr:SGNH/GDSL hydrolase family protein [Mariluticola halotolerans]UJQ94987.1 SGNH/GDSL hydrolase family protein [Mariluticola halotolerans]